MFMGVLPASQYGSVAVLPSSYHPAHTPDHIVTNTPGSNEGSSSYLVNPAGVKTVETNTPNPSSSKTLTVRLNSDLSALSIRATEYLQRWKEVVQFSSKDYSDQMSAQFGVKAPEYMGNHSHYIGGWSSVININEVVNTNLDTDSSQALVS